MSEQEETADYPADDDAPDSGRRSSRGFAAAFAVLLSLVSLVAAGYLYWRVEGVGGSGGIVPRLGDDIERLEGELARARSMSRSGTEEVQEDIAELEQALVDYGESVGRVQAELSDGRREDRSPDPGEWRLAEVEYLLRIANNRILMERDARAADQMLAAADAILEELDDYALHEVRAILAEERLALADTTTANPQSVFLTLEAIKDALPELPLKQPEYFERKDAAAIATTGSRSADVPGRVFREVGAESETASDKEPTASDAEPKSIGQALRDRFYGLFEFRTRDSVAPRPLIRPEEAIYLELNLRLALERAQLAMLRGDQTLFATSLNSARQWLDEYVDPEHAATQRIAQDLDRLTALDIEQPMPDISRSLASLLEIGSRSVDPEPPDQGGQTE